MMLFLLPYMAIMSRLHGWGGFKFCRPLSTVGLTLPFVIAVEQYTENLFILIPVAVLTYLGFTLGHADGFKDYVRDNAPTSNIAVFIADRLGILRNSTEYDFLFFWVKGLLIALPTLLALEWVHHSFNNLAFLLFATFAWPVSYNNHSTVIGEWFTGIWLGTALVWVLT